MTAARRWLPDAIAGAVVLAVLAFVIWRAWGRSFDPIIDAGRDLYIAGAIRSGARLYRDLVYLFPPLAPYVVALWSSIAGSSLAAFQSLGAAVALATAAAIYAEVRSSGSAASAGAAALMFAASSVYSVSDRASNYLLPYSQAATMGTLLFIAGGALLLMRRAVATPFGLTALVASSWMKVEYGAFAALVIVLVAWTQGIRSRRVIPYAVALVASLGSIGWYLASGEALLFNTAVSKPFYRMVMGLDEPIPNLLANLRGFLYLAAIGVTIAIASRLGRAAMIAAAAVVAVIGWYAGLDFFRGWLLFQLLLLPFALMRPREPLLVMLVISLCASSRIGLRMTPQWYGFVFLAAVYGVVAYALIDWIPQRGWYSRNAALLWLIPIVIVSIEMVIVEVAVMSVKRFPVVSQRGTFFDANRDRAAILNEFLRAYGGGQRMQSLVVVPEGLGINYLAGVPAPLSFNNFTPGESGTPWIERQIIAQMESRRPQYVAVVSRSLTDFGSRGFGLDYNRQFAALIRKRYAVERVWRRPLFELIVLRRRS